MAKTELKETILGYIKQYDIPEFKYTSLEDYIINMYGEKIMSLYNVPTYHIRKPISSILSEFMQWKEPLEQNDKDTGRTLITKSIIEVKGQYHNRLIELINPTEETVLYEFWEVYTHPFSKFYDCGKVIDIDGIKYKTIEHYYQSQKVLDLELKQKIINAPTYEEAHLMGQCVDTVDNWFEINTIIYYKGQKAKFEQFPKLKKKVNEYRKSKNMLS